MRINTSNNPTGTPRSLEGLQSRIPHYLRRLDGANHFTITPSRISFFHRRRRRRGCGLRDSSSALPYHSEYGERCGTLYELFTARINCMKY